MQQLLLGLSRAPVPTLANFAAGRNGETLKCLERLIDGDLPERCVYLWGVSGSGKTHLLRAVADAVPLSQYVAGRTASEVPAWCDAPQLVAVDDVQYLSADAQSALFALFQRLVEHDVHLLISADLPPASLGMREDVRTRLAAGLVFQLHVLSDEEKADALRMHARMRGFELSPDVGDYLMRHKRRDLPSLTALIDALDQYSLQRKRPVTLPLLRELLQLSD